MQESIEQRLASDVTTLISAARIEQGRLQMPEQLPDERYNLPYTGLLGYIFDRQGALVWRSRATNGQNINYRPRYDGRGNEFARIHQMTARNSSSTTWRSSCSGQECRIQYRGAAAGA